VRTTLTFPEPYQFYEPRDTRRAVSNAVLNLFEQIHKKTAERDAKKLELDSELFRLKHSFKSIADLEKKKTMKEAVSPTSGCATMFTQLCYLDG
jgi:hypothetical protein